MIGIYGRYAGVNFKVERDRKPENFVSADAERDPTEGTLNGLWRWYTQGQEQGAEGFTGVEASRDAAISAAQEQCALIPKARKTDYTAVAF